MGTWRKSTHSSSDGGNCVEVADGGGIMVRDTKDNGTGPALAFTASAWSRFVASI